MPVLLYDATHHAGVYSTTVQAASALPAGLTRRAREGAICNPLDISKIPDQFSRFAI
jgi:hypothetical protein